MPLQATSGAASYDGFGGGVVAEPNYIESCFSTYLYTGNDTSQTITNGIDLSGKGGLTWIKARTAAQSNALFDTSRGPYNFLFSNNTNEQANYSPYGVTAFNANGFSVAGGGGYVVNGSGTNYASWTFRKQPKFFDVVTFVKDSSTNQRISHSLGSVPGCIIVKRVTSADDWYVYHRSLGGLNKWISLNSTGAVSTTAGAWGSSAPTDTDFGVSTNLLYDGGGTPLTYVAYLFAHDAGGFGLTGTDNVISCGSFTTDASGRTTIDLGYEPQWVLIKRATGGTGNWEIADNMRKWTVSGNAALYPNLSNAENNPDNYKLNATGFSTDNGVGSSDFIYIAIRRGPMKVPTSGTSVFSPNRWTSTVGSSITTNFPLDLQISKWMGAGGDSNFVQDRLRGLNTVTTNSAQPYLLTESTAAEGTNSGANYNFGNTGFLVGDNDSANGWAINFRRAPSFFDEVCYTGTGSATTVAHNLTVVPEMMIVKDRTSSSYDWRVYSATLSATKYLKLNGDSGEAVSSAVWNDTSPTASVFTVGTNATVNGSGDNYVAYLFATCAGVSKVGSYTGTGTTLQVNCGFTGGARFVLIKRTDSTGDWYVWDSARGIVSGNDPYLLLNSTAAEVTSTDYIDTYSAGFEISSTAPAAINANGGTFIFLAIA